MEKKRKVGRKSLEEMIGEKPRIIGVPVPQSVFDWMHAQESMNMSGFCRNAIIRMIKEISGKDFSK
jgi:hypothetical protein